MAVDILRVRCGVCWLRCIDLVLGVCFFAVVLLSLFASRWLFASTMLVVLLFFSFAWWKAFGAELRCLP